ncbi:MAG: hypothetical protein HOV94_10960, partial [Saccharothrix sp.]|nr:hypothetical protein [Saccharothrix sp.]
MQQSADAFGAEPAQSRRAVRRHGCAELVPERRHERPVRGAGRTDDLQQPAAVTVGEIPDPRWCPPAAGERRFDVGAQAAPRGVGQCPAALVLRGDPFAGSQEVRETTAPRHEVEQRGQPPGRVGPREPVPNVARPLLVARGGFAVAEPVQAQHGLPHRVRCRGDPDPLQVVAVEDKAQQRFSPLAAGDSFTRRRRSSQRLPRRSGRWDEKAGLTCGDTARWDGVSADPEQD